MSATPNPHASLGAEAGGPGQSTSGAAAVMIGAAIGIGVAYAVLFVCGLIFLWVLVAQGVPAADTYARAYESTRYLVFAHAVGFLCGVPGGYWSARLSAARPLRSAVLSGALVVLFTFLQNLIPYYLPVPLWSRTVAVLVPLPAFVCGAWLWLRRGRR
jgi:hypothetical protein